MHNVFRFSESSNKTYLYLLFFLVADGLALRGGSLELVAAPVVVAWIPGGP